MPIDDVRALWQNQSQEAVRLTPQEMEKRMRRHTYDMYAATVLISLTLITLTALFPHPLLIAGAAMSVCGLAFVAYESRIAARSHPADTAASLDHHRALLSNRIEFHRRRLWLRVLALGPGGLLFFLGFAAAQPRLAWLIYLQLLTFVVAIALMIPLNRRNAARLQRKVEHLDQLR
ncbi:MAG TPA: hypothetical protein VNI54_10160 [Thermoanaerobaculia bacterium]|nr:hypothetical protein [Thermoanaerobaculia bacterium]